MKFIRGIRGMLWPRKLIFLFLIFTLFCVSGTAIAQNITISGKNISLAKLFKSIENQTGYVFFYSPDVLNDAKTVSIQASGKKLTEVLNYCLKGQPLTFSIVDKTIFIRKAATKKIESSVNAGDTTRRPVEHEIRVHVADSTGQPLQAASVFIKGTSRGAQTGSDGNVAFKVMPGAELTISSVGFETQQINVEDKSDISVKLKQTSNSLNDIVMVAYGKQKKATLTGSVAQISGEEVAKAPVANISNSLQGRLPGLQFQQTSGQPGMDAASINIRGFGDALTIVDGVATDISQINPNDIESVTILKDGAAAMYGFKASNGAIIITTKRGRSGHPVLSLDAYTGIQGNAVPYPRLVNAGEFTELTDEAAINSYAAENPTGGLPQLPYSQSEVDKWKAGTDSGYQSTDWYNTVFKKYSSMSSVNLNVRGGNDIVKYFISGGLLDQNGLLRSDNSTFRRYNLRSNIDVQISKRLKASLFLSGRLENTLQPPGPGITDAGGGTSVVSSIIRAYPTYTPYANNSTEYFGVTNVPSVNPLATASSQAGYSRNTTAVFNGSAVIEYEIPYIDGLSAKLNFNYEYQNANSKTWLKEYSLYNFNQGAYDIGSTVNSPTTLNQYTYQGGTPSDLQLSLNYDHTFFGGHHLSGLLLLQKTKTSGTNFSAQRNFSLDALDQLQLGDISGQSITVNPDGSVFFQTAYMGYAGRINYNYKEKYLAEFGGRYDYSWKFPNGAGFFPEISAGWVVSKEGFFNVPFVSSLKLKASWARTPDDANFDGFNYISGYNYPSGSYLFNPGVPTNGLQIGNYANPSLTWSVGTLYNGGIEWGLLNDMISGEFNIFYRKRTGLPATVQTTYPSVSGINPPQANLNADNTRGFELQLGFRKNIGDIQITVSPNLAYSRTMNGFQINPPAGSAWYNYTGNSAYRWQNIGRGYVALGQFMTQDEINVSPIQDGNGNLSLRPGDIKYKDLNGDGVINGDDQTAINRGSFPKIQYGMNVAVSYKAFDLSALFAGAADFDVVYSSELQSPLFNGSSTFEFFTDRWHHENIFDPNSPWVPGKYPSTIAGGSSNNTQPSTFWTKNGSYLRLKTLDIGYTLSKKVLEGTGITKARLYFSGQNLFIITGIKYIDPENFAANGRGSYYPIQKLYTIGVNLSF